MLLAFSGAFSFFLEREGRRLAVADLTGIVTLIVTAFLVILATGYLNRTVKLLQRGTTRQIVIYAMVSVLLVGCFYLSATNPIDEMGKWTATTICLTAPALIVLSNVATSPAMFWCLSSGEKKGKDSLLWDVGRGKRDIGSMVVRILFFLDSLLLVYLEVRLGEPMAKLLLLAHAMVFWWAGAHLAQTIYYRVQDDRNWTEEEAERYVKYAYGRSIVGSFRKFNALTETGPWDAPYLTAEVANRVGGYPSLQSYLGERHRKAGIPAPH